MRPQVHVRLVGCGVPRTQSGNASSSQLVSVYRVIRRGRRGRRGSLGNAHFVYDLDEARAYEERVAESIECRSRTLSNQERGTMMGGWISRVARAESAGRRHGRFEEVGT